MLINVKSYYLYADNSKYQDISKVIWDLTSISII